MASSGFLRIITSFSFIMINFFAVAEFDKEGKEFVDYVLRSRPPLIPFTDQQDRKPNF